MPDDKDETLAYYTQVLQDIRDIKARPWNFITILVAITCGILALANAGVKSVRGLCCSVWQLRRRDCRRQYRPVQ
jgi:hypothetical protein